MTGARVNHALSVASNLKSGPPQKWGLNIALKLSKKIRTGAVRTMNLRAQFTSKIVDV